MGVELHEHQINALQKLDNGKILQGGVGSGKSIVSIAWYYTKIGQGTIKINGVGEMTQMKRVVPLYIFTSAKKRESLDWLTELGRYALGPVTHPIVIDSWNNITNYKDVKNAVIIFDEQRLVGNGAWVQTFYKLAANNQWIMLSATPGDRWLDYIPVFVANGFYRNRTEFLRRHVVYNNFSKFPKVDHDVEVGHLEKLRRKILVDMPYARHTVRHVKFVNCEHDEALYLRVWKDRWHVYEDRPIKDVGELFLVLRKVVNSDSSRLDQIFRLLEVHPRLIVFYNFNYELEQLRSLTSVLSSDVTIAEWNGQKHEAVPDTDSWLYLVQYMAGAEAWECTTTDAIAFYSLNYSYRLNEQARGRIDRMNTPFKDLYYYVFKSNTMIDRAIWTAVSHKKNFSESSFSKKMGLE